MMFIRKIFILAGLLWTLTASAATYHVAQFGHGENINDLAFNPTGQLLASASNDRSIRIWNDKGFIFSVLEGHQDSVDQVVFVDEFTLVSVDRSGEFIAWDAFTEYPTKLEGFDRYSVNTGGRTLNYNPTSRVLAHIGFRSFEWTVLDHKPFNKKQVKLNVQKLPLSFRTRGMALSPEGTLAAVVAKDGNFVIIDISKAKIIYTSNINHVVNAVSFVNEKEILLAGDGITRFDLYNKKIKQKQQNKGFWSSFDIRINPVHRNELLLNGGHLKIVDLDSGETLLDLDEISSHGLAYSPDGSRIALVSSEFKSCRGNFSEIKIFNTEDKSEINSYPAGFFTINSVALSRDNLLAINTCNNGIELWNLNNFKPQKPLQKLTSKPTALSFSADEKTLFVSDYDGSLTKWSLNDANPTLLDQSSKEYFNSVTTSSDGRWLAYGEYDNDSENKIVNIFLKDLKANIPAVKINFDFYLQIEHLDFTSNGHYLVVTDFYHNATFIDLSTFKPVANIPFENYKEESFFDNSDKMVEHFVISSKGEFMFTSSHNYVHKWTQLPTRTSSGKPNNPQLLKSIKGDMNKGLALSNDDKLLAVIEYRDIVIFRSKDLTEIHRIKGIAPQHVLFSADGNYLISITSGGRVLLMDMHNKLKVVGEIQNITELSGYSVDYRKGTVTPQDENQRQPVVIKIIKNGQVKWKDVGKNPE